MCRRGGRVVPAPPTSGRRYQDGSRPAEPPRPVPSRPEGKCGAGVDCQGRSFGRCGGAQPAANNSQACLLRARRSAPGRPLPAAAPPLPARFRRCAARAACRRSADAGCAWGGRAWLAGAGCRGWSQGGFGTGRLCVVLAGMPPRIAPCGTSLVSL